VAWCGEEVTPPGTPSFFFAERAGPNLHLKVTLLRTLLQAVNEQALPQPYLFMHGAHTETIMVAHHVCVCVCVCVCVGANVCDSAGTITTCVCVRRAIVCLPWVSVCVCVCVCVCVWVGGGVVGVGVGGAHTPPPNPHTHTHTHTHTYIHTYIHVLDPALALTHKKTGSRTRHHGICGITYASQQLRTQATAPLW
jgi:hypothetical protein